jgi:hypothetical protein
MPVDSTRAKPRANGMITAAKWFQTAADQGLADVEHASHKHYRQAKD